MHPTLLRNRWRRAALCATCALWLLGSPSCVGTEVGNPQDEPDDGLVTLQLAAQGERTSAGITLTDGTIIEQVWVSLGPISLRRADACSDEGEVMLSTGPVVAELVSGVELPSRPSARISARSFCRVKLSFDALEQMGPIEGAPRALSEVNLYVLGRTRSGERVVIQSDIRQTIVLHALDEEIALDEPSAGLLAAASIEDWITPEVFEGARIEGGELRIDQKHNQSRQALLRRNLREALRLYVDADRDGRASSGRDRLIETKADELSFSQEDD